MSLFQRNNYFPADRRFSLIMTLSIGLATVQFVYNRSLWLDEAMLALNIVDRKFLGLLTPLDHIQVAPILFLEIEKMFSLLIPDSEFGLRLLPFLAFILSTYFFIKLLNLTNLNKYMQWFGLSLFAFNPTMIYYSSEVKQYMCDVLVLTSMYYFILKPYHKPKNQFYILTFVGVISIFLSNIAPIILFTSGLFLLYRYSRGESVGLVQILFMSVIWLVIFWCYFYFFIAGHPSREMMLTYWTNQDAFFTANPFDILFYKFVWDKWIMITTVLFQLGGVWKAIITLFVVVGIMRLLWLRNVTWLILTTVPIIIHLFISSLRLYPFETRLILYTCPLIVILCLFGLKGIMEMIYKIFQRDLVSVVTLALTLGIVIGGYAKGFYGSRFPFQNEEVKSCLNFITEHKRKADNVYIHGVSHYFFDYYRSIRLFSISDDRIAMSKSLTDVDGEVQKLVDSGESYWLLFCHLDNGDAYLKRLKKLGFNPTDEFAAPASVTYRFSFTRSQ